MRQAILPQNGGIRHETLFSVDSRRPASVIFRAFTGYGTRLGSISKEHPRGTGQRDEARFARSPVLTYAGEHRWFSSDRDVLMACPPSVVPDVIVCPMEVRTSIRVVLWSALAGCLVAISTFLLMDWMIPGQVSIDPALPGEIVVTVDGAVATPGIVRLPAGSRLNAAIDASGGFTDHANTTGLNLAARIGDAELITIPAKSAVATPSTGTEEVAPLDPSGALIDVNSAGISELDQLPGVGPAIAQRIIDYRETNGRFESIEELDDIEGISADMAEELRPLVTLGD